MPRSHARILCSIWSDADFVSLTGAAQRMYVLLLSQRLVNHAGVAPLTIQKWANLSADTNVSGVRAALAELEANRFVVVDEGTQEVLVRSFIRGDGVDKQPNVLKAALRLAEEVDSPLLRATLSAELTRLGKTNATEVAARLTSTSSEKAEAFPNPSETLREPLPVSSPDSRGNGEGETFASSSTSDVVTSRSRVSKTKRATRIPDDFQVDPEMVTWAREHAPDVDGRVATAGFIDHWRGKGGKDATKLDWVATWRNWLRREQTNHDRYRKRGSPTARPNADDTIRDLLAPVIQAANGANVLQLPRGEHS